VGIDTASSQKRFAVQPQSREVFLEEHFVLAVLYVQLRACPVGVYGRALLDFRQMFSATKMLVIPNVRVFHRSGGISVSAAVGRQPMRPGDKVRPLPQADSSAA